MATWRITTTDDLLRAVLALKTLDEARRFFRDLLTEQELLEFGRRWRAARMLNAGCPYTEIVETTGLSSTTVARISKWLKTGMGGYQLMLERLGRNPEKRLMRIHHHHHDHPSRGGGALMG